MSETAQISELLQQGIAAARAGRKEEARRALMRVIELDERNEHAWLWLSGVVDSPQDRRICMENVLAINPDNAVAQAGLLWLDREETAQPSTAPAQTEEGCPWCGAGLSRYGRTCTACGQPLLVVCPACGEYADVVETACPGCDEPLGNFREGARYHLELARAYFRRSRFPLAEEALAFAEAEMPDDVQLLVGIAALYEALKRPGQAIAIYEHIVALAPANATARARLDDLYRRSGQPDKAQALHEQIAQKNGKSPQALLPPYEPNYGWGETIRRMGGLLLSPILAAWVNARLIPTKISLAVWIALLAASIGAYLWVSATEVPKNPGMCVIFGEVGVRGVGMRIFMGLSGALLWLLAFGFILIKVRG